MRRYYDINFNEISELDVKTLIFENKQCYCIEPDIYINKPKLTMHIGVVPYDLNKSINMVSSAIYTFGQLCDGGSGLMDLYFKGNQNGALNLLKQMKNDLIDIYKKLFEIYKEDFDEPLATHIYE